MFPKIEGVLKEFLSNNEVRIYLSLLRMGPSSAGKITKETGIHRRNVYDSLERLQEKGLACRATRSGVACFEATNPEQLQCFIRNQQDLLRERGKNIADVIPFLANMKKLRNESQDVKIFSGKESRKIIFEDILNSADVNHVLGAHTPSKLSGQYLKQWHKRRVKKGIRDKLIYNKDDPYSKELASISFTEVRLMPNKIDSSTTFNIYGDKVAVLFWSGEKPVTILIENKKVAQDFKNYFQVLWESARVV
ncbi:MAG: hypothetical protein ISS93_03800 [Candidatus Aenigmarchaeota archaeon]|nr:hypothetical protein [Candidatus Aenigmarchaeota archaeon]